jgi:hypothetical protein
MSILSSNNANIESNIKDWIKKHLVNIGPEDFELKKGPFTEIIGSVEIKYPEGYIINIKNKDVVLVNYKEKEKKLPDYIHFGSIIAGNFICLHSNLISMRGFPQNVGGHFDCCFCENLESIEGAPRIVDKDFALVHCGKEFTEEEIRKATIHITGKIYC